MKKIFTLSLSAIILLATSCSRNVTRVEPDELKDINGTWNSIDSREMAQAMISQSLTGEWLGKYKNEKGRMPTVIVGMITNKSHEHIEAETFMNDLEKSFVESGKINLVQSGKKREEMRGEKADQQTNSSVSTMKKFGLEKGADYILQGSINSIVDAYKRKKSVMYEVTLTLTDIQTNEVAWIGDKKLAKNIRN